MKYEVLEEKIVIYGLDDFVPSHILECGQIFRFVKHKSEDYTVYFGNNYARVTKEEDTITIKSNNLDKCIEFFDLNRDYEKLKNKLKKHKLLEKGISMGHGIRILKSAPEEMIFSFIISANNNIKRIQKIIEKLCELGDDMGGYRAFPTAKQIASASDEFMESLHAGYRAPYLKETAKMLVGCNYDKLQNLSTHELKKWLVGLKGVGPKVASCILLFGFNRWDVFPVDTWINKVYYDHFNVGNKTRPQIERFFVDLFGEDVAGLSQQYLFYWKKETSSK